MEKDKFEMNGIYELVDEDEESSDGMRSLLQLIYIPLILSLTIFFLIVKFFFFTAVVKGHSMLPTLHEGDRVIVIRPFLARHQFDRGDIVILDGKEALYQETAIKYNIIKRIIGVPGDIIDIKDGNVILNGNILIEPYIVEGIDTEAAKIEHWELKDDEYFVLGDNRYPNESQDSRYFGPVSYKSIMGKIRQK